MGLVLWDVNPILAMGGQIAAIIICVFLFIMVILLLAVNLGSAFAFAWLREKIQVIKKLRPVVDSVNKSSEAALQGVPAAENENTVVRAVASVPAGLHTANHKVEQTSRKVANAVIEFRARTVQVQTIAKAMLLPGLNRRRPVPEVPVQMVSKDGHEVLEEPELAPVEGVMTQKERKQAIAAVQRQYVSPR